MNFRRTDVAVTAPTVRQLAAEDPQVAVTVTLPTSRTDQEALRSQVTNLAGELRDGLEGHEQDADEFVDRLNDVLRSIDPRSLSDGLWVGLDERNTYLATLDQAPPAAVRVAAEFDLVALARQEQQVTRVLVVTIAEPGADVFVHRTDGRTLDDRLMRIVHPDLPVVFGGEEARRGRDTGSHQRDDRYRQWLRQIVHVLEQVRRNDRAVADLPVVAVGIGRYLAFAGEVAAEPFFDLGVEVSPESISDAELDERVTDATVELASAHVAGALAHLDAARSARRAAFGTPDNATDVIELARQGRGQRLLITDGADHDRWAATIVDVMRFGGRVITIPAGSLEGDATVVLTTRW